MGEIMWKSPTGSLEIDPTIYGLVSIHMRDIDGNWATCRLPPDDFMRVALEFGATSNKRAVAGLAKSFLGPGYRIQRHVLGAWRDRWETIV